MIYVKRFINGSEFLHEAINPTGLKSIVVELDGGTIELRVWDNHITLLGLTGGLMVRPVSGDCIEVHGG